MFAPACVLTRRGLLTVLGLATAGGTVSYLLRTRRPIGRYVGSSTWADTVLADKTSPTITYKQSNLTLVAFTDYQCPACRKAHPAMMAAVGRDGKVRLVFKDWPVFGERSERAARVALAADRQGIYPEVHGAFMSSPTLDDAAMQRAVVRAGGSWQRLEQDMSAFGPAIAEQLARNRLQAFGLGLEGTPGYLIGPFVLEGAHTGEEFLRAFSQARATLKSGTGGQP